MALQNFHPAVAAWFRRAFPEPTPAQLQAWPAIQSGRHALIAAPTGSGKTLAAFLAAIDDLVRRGLDTPLADETFVVYVSPLKALSNDVRINLEAPLNGIRDELLALGLPDVEIRTMVRTGDTPQAERDRMRRQPPHIVVTTPESLYILLGSESGRAMLASTRTVIVDEIHALAPNKRGAHLALSLERLEALCGRRLTRIGLSATQKPVAEVARYLVGASSRARHPGDSRDPGPVPAAEEKPLDSGVRRNDGPETVASVPAHAAAGTDGDEPGHDASRVEAQLAPASDSTSMSRPVCAPGTVSEKAADCPAIRSSPLAISRSERSSVIDCEIVDVGYSRRRDLALELPQSPLQAVMSGDVWLELHARLAELIEQHRTTLIFVNTRRMAERLARHLSEKLGKEAVTSHHGSLAREQRLAAEQRLKRGELRALIATASLELGIDIGDVDLVCQIASPRSISAFLQRVGRSGHSVGGTPKGRLFPLSRDDLVECAALLDAVRRGELDTLHVEHEALDVLAQQIVAEVAAREWNEEALFALVTRAYPFARLARKDFTDILRMLAEGYTTRRGPRGAYLHRDAVNGVLRARRGARLTALTSGGAIPDTADYDVMLEPQAQKIGTVHEDFAVESMAGDIFQLGNASYRVLRIERGTVRVEDAQGLPPTIPFWLGEAPGRSDELSFAVSRLREEVSARLGTTLSHPRGATAAVVTGEINALSTDALGGQGRQAPGQALSPVASDGGEGAEATGQAVPPIASDGREGAEARARTGGPEARKDAGQSAFDWLTDDVGLAASAARQIVEYLGGAKAAFGMLPTQQALAMERFFDESGGMQLVIHSPYGSRVNRAWGLALRKRFCRSFNFELQAAATEDAIILSLSTSHSFPLEEVTRYLHSNSVREVLVQALLDAPMFGLRWRWNATTALALPRFLGGSKVAPQLQRMKSEDLLASVFPDQVACLENIVGDRQIPEHPLVAQTLHDCLHGAMDIEALERLLKRLESGEIHFVCRDLTAPSPFAAEILNARPYAFLDDAPLEERRTQAVMSRRWGDYDTTDDFGKLDADAIAAVRAEAWPEARDADELHDALMSLAFITAAESIGNTGWPELFDKLVESKRAARLLFQSAVPGGEGWCEGATPRPLPGVAEDGGASASPQHSPAAQSGERQPVRRSDRNGICIAAERLPEFTAVFPHVALQPPLEAPAEFASVEWTREAALTEIVRGRLGGLGPVRAAELAVSLHLPQVDIDAALVALETEGYAMRGRFTPDARDSEWCERHLLARIHRYTVRRLRREIEPVAPRDFLRFLFEWQHVAPGAQVSGPDALAAVLAQLEGFEVAAAAWESDVLPARVAGYEISWLDDLCLSGRIAWSRLRNSGRRPSAEVPLPRSGRAGARSRSEGWVEGDRSGPTSRSSARSGAAVARAPTRREGDDARERGPSGPVRATPIVLAQRRNMPTWSALAAAAPDSAPTLSSRALSVADELKQHGASFFDELLAATHLLHTELEDALAELVAAGMVTADSYAGLRALLVPSAKRPSTSRRRGRRPGLFGIADAGRWSLLRKPPRTIDESRKAATDPELVEFAARTLLRRYGVVCWRVLGREPQWLPPWRDLLRVYHRLEARGEIRGGRFIAGLSGEQFALPEAIALLRGARQKPHEGSLVAVCAADPLNLVGHLVAGAKVPNQAGARVLYRDGAPVATLLGGQFTALEPMDDAAEWAARSRLLRAQADYAPAAIGVPGDDPDGG